VPSDDTEQASDAPPPTTGEEFDRSLAWAEMLLARIEHTHERLALIRLLGVTAATGTVFVGIVVMTLTSTSGFALASTTLVAVLLIIALQFLVRFWLTVPLQRMLRRDEEAVVERTEVLRQFLSFLEKQEQWGHVRRDLAHARLARFPIAPGGSWRR
jgi:hypothetical protein